MQASSGYIGLMPKRFVRTMRISSSTEVSSSDSKNSFLKLLPEPEAVGCPWLLATSLFLYFRSCLSITSSTRSTDTYISSLVCSERIMFPFTGMVTSIFWRSFSTLSVTIISVSGVKYLSSFPNFCSIASFKPGVTSMFFPLIIKFILVNSFCLYCTKNLSL